MWQIAGLPHRVCKRQGSDIDVFLERLAPEKRGGEKSNSFYNGQLR